MVVGGLDSSIKGLSLCSGWIIELNVGARHLTLTVALSTWKFVGQQRTSSFNGMQVHYRVKWS